MSVNKIIEMKICIIDIIVIVKKHITEIIGPIKLSKIYASNLSKKDCIFFCVLLIFLSFLYF